MAEKLTSKVEDFMLAFFQKCQPLDHSALATLVSDSKLVEVVTVADVDVDSEDHVGNSLLQIWELTFGSKA